MTQQTRERTITTRDGEITLMGSPLFRNPSLQEVIGWCSHEGYQLTNMRVEPINSRSGREVEVLPVIYANDGSREVIILQDPRDVANWYVASAYRMME